MQYHTQTLTLHRFFRKTALILIIRIATGSNQTGQGIPDLDRHFITQLTWLAASIGPIVFDLDQPGALLIQANKVDCFGATKSAIELITVERPSIVLLCLQRLRKREG